MMKPIHLKDNKYIDSAELCSMELHSEKEVSNKDRIFKIKISDHVRISEDKNIFAKGYTPNWSEDVFVISKIKNTVP